MNRTAEYERRLSGSYMKIPVEDENTFDERMVINTKPKGILPMEKCFYNGKAEYWYRISGKQSFESFCQCHEIGIVFVEKVIVSVCSQVAIMEKHMLNPDGLLLLPEYLYVDNHTQEIIFTFYPGDTVELSLQFQRLMEYLLTKVNHKDTDAVAMAYGLYEKTLEEGYSIWDIQESIAENRANRGSEKAVGSSEREIDDKQNLQQEKTNKDFEEGLYAVEPMKEKGSIWSILKKNEVLKEWYNTLHELGEKIKCIFNKKNMNCKNGEFENGKRKKGGREADRYRKKTFCKQVEKQVIYPSDHEPVREDMACHPTICLSDYREHPDGFLLYEGYEDFEDIRLEKRNAIIGKGEGADIRINKETISHVHAKLSYENEEYYLEDLNSTNGCMVNGKLLNYHERQKLQRNDILYFADVKYRFV